MNNLDDNRPNPDELLASLMHEEEKSKRGKLKIFFGMCAGVGKTYTMLQTAHAEKSKGSEIVIGYIETHNRKETSELVDGFELIPRKTYEYKSTLVKEMDLDAIIARKPHVVLVDELAHTNAPGSRHTKRFQDVQELLENGINVYTTLNVQHLESRSETVAQITGIIVRETLPDNIFESADEVELIDLSPDGLLERLSEGKVYTSERSKEAIENFFRKGNITALREMALRIVAERVDKQLHDYMQYKRIKGPWKSGLHLLVAIGISPFSARLLRWAKHLSSSMGAQVQALYVETSHKLTDKEKEQLDKNIKLAKQLGMEVRFKSNNDTVKAIVGYAQKENITHIIVGKPRVRNIYSMLKLGVFVNRLIRYSGNIDVYILGADSQAKDSYKGKVTFPSFTSGYTQYFVTSILVILSSILCYTIKDLIGYQSVSFVLLFLVSILALFYGMGPILLASILSALIWNLFFIPPQFTLHIDKHIDIMMFIMFFIIALLNGVLTSRVRKQEKKIRVREERTNALYQLTKDLTGISGYEAVTIVASNYIHKYFNVDSFVFIKTESGQLEYQTHIGSDKIFSENEMSIANWVFKNSSKAGKNTDTLPSSDYTFFPLMGNNNAIGVIAIKQLRAFTFGEEQFWETSISQLTSKYEREMLREASKRTYIISESEKLYKILFNSLSHELRIPVATILGASDTLIAQEYAEDTRQQLYHEINSASIRLNKLIENLLNMSRLESGLITPRFDWCDIHDLANRVADSLQNELKPFKLSVIIPSNMPMVNIDFGLMEQVLHNLVLNATQHSPMGSQIRVKFFFDNGFLTIQVMDRGTGFLSTDIHSVFNKFYRGKEAKAGGTGLGLSIVKGFIEAHKGSVVVENRQNGGALFTIKIPVEISDINSLNNMRD